MGVTDRILLSIYSLAIGLIALFGAIIGLPVLFGEEEIIQWIRTVHGDVWFHVLLIGFSLLFFLVSLRLIWVSLHRNSSIDKGIDQETEIGNVHISLTTIEEIVISSAQRVKGVHDLTARVYYDKENSSLSIGLKMVIDGKIPIQSLSKELQQVVKDQVETIAGVEVDQVSIYVAQTKKPSQKRLRVS